jgi:hypothetical protein
MIDTFLAYPSFILIRIFQIYSFTVMVYFSHYQVVFDAREFKPFSHTVPQTKMLFQYTFLNSLLPTSHPVRIFYNENIFCLFFLYI